jgi:hypothetical protein
MSCGKRNSREEVYPIIQQGKRFFDGDLRDGSQ